MQELKSTKRLSAQVLEKAVTIFFHPKFIVLAGTWHWEMASDAVFCSDVMLSLPAQFPGTKGIIHPEDVGIIKEKLIDEKNIDLEFRIITTYGEVKTLTGENVSVEEMKTCFDEVKDHLQANLIEASSWREEYEHLRLFREIQEREHRYNSTGIWWYNESSSETWYSAGVFHIYDIAPHSLNAHLNTFNAFLHPEDREIVEEFFNKAFTGKAPLHMEYRIRTVNSEKYVREIMEWLYNDRGEWILSGVLQDITEQKNREADLELIENRAIVFKQQLVFDEQHIPVGHWQVNLITRKTTFSENLFRLLGLRKGEAENPLLSIEQIHPDDRERYRTTYSNMLQQHTPPEIDFRIYRGDGKLRYFTQKAKLIRFGNDLMMIGTVQDVTLRKSHENSVKELKKAVDEKALVQNQLETIGGLAFWTWNPKDDHFYGSENLYRMLGSKRSSIELNHKKLLSFVHPEDQKIFTDHLTTVLLQKAETGFEFRLLQAGKTRNITASFRVIENDGDEIFIATLHDRTIEHLLRKRLNERIHLAETLSENIIDRVIITDTNNTILVWNKPCERIYGFKKDDVLGKNFFDVFPRLKTTEQLQMFSGVMKGESIFIQGNKSVLWNGYYDLHLLPLWDDNQGQVSGIIHIVHDVTKEMELRQSLKQRLSFIESLLEASVDQVVVLDRYMNYLYWNKKAEEYYGISKQEIIGKNILEVFPSFRNQASYSEFRKVLKGETVHIPAAENEEKGQYSETYLIPIKDEIGITAILWIVHDLSREYKLRKDKKMADKKIEEQSHYLKRITETTPDMISIREVETGKFTFLNEQTFIDHGFDPADILGRSGKGDSALIHPDDDEVLKNYFQSFTEASDEDIISAEYRAKTKDGRWKWFSVRGKVFQRNAAGKVTHQLNVIEDITDRRNAEASIDQTSQLLQTVLDTSLIGICLHEAVYNKQGELSDFRMRIVNKELEKLTGRNDLKDKLYTQEFPGVKQSGLFNLMREALQTGKPKTLEYAYQHDGFQKTFVSTFAPSGRYLVATNLDITERKNVELELQTQLTLLTFTESLAQSGSWEYEIVTGKFYWSEGMYELFGLPGQIKVQPEFYLDHCIEEDLPIARAIVNHLKEKHCSFEEILRVYTQDEIRTIKIKGSVQSDENGHPLKMVGVDIDITNIKQAEDKLRESRHWLEQTARASPDSINVYDLEKKQATYLNTCLAEWMGITDDELSKMGAEQQQQWIHPDDRINLLQFNEQVAAAKDGEVTNIEYRVQTEKGKIIWLRNRSKPFLRDASGKVTHILSVLQNVTEEVQLREELRRRTQYAEAVIDASIDRIAVFDRDLRIIAWNKRSEVLTGRKKENVIGQKLFDVFPRLAQDEELRKAHLDALGGSYISFPAKKGVYTDRYYERFFIPLKNEKEETYAILNIMHDVSVLVQRNTELSELNKSLEQKNRELEQKNEEVTSFAFVASHDMREPLRKIHTFSDWLLEQESSHLSEKGRILVEKMNSSVHRMEHLIGDILVLTKIHTDTHKDDQVNLNEVLKLVIEDMSEKISATQTIIHSEKMPTIIGNTNQLFYLFKNLLSNAIKFQKPGNVPQINISVGIVQGAGFNLKEMYSKISFADNGFGFDKRYVKKIFQVFQRLHGKHEFEGTGIGLAICKKIMDNHDGFISVESEPGKGSVFSCHFPTH